MAQSPTELSLAECRRRGWTVDVAERWIPRTKKRRDLFNFADLVALDVEGHKFVAIQTTSSSNTSAREKKILASEEAQAWKECGGRVLVWGWGRRCKNGKRGAQKIWTLKESEM